jgi:alpha-L-fucosidase
MNIRRFLCLLLAVVPGILSTPSGRAENMVRSETKEQRDERMGWWRDARYGLFIHWGLYALPAGEWNGKKIWGGGEWIQHCGNIPVAEYAALAGQFHPVKFNADEWVSMAKKAGIRYIVITAKHHDGFAMFETKASPFNIVDATPFKRDILKELTEACRKQGMPLGFYYSQSQDWHHAGGTAWPFKERKDAIDHVPGDMDKYLDAVAVPQVRELLSNYGKDTPVCFWWDTPLEMTPERAKKLADAVRELRPKIVTNSRLGGGIGGDTANAEQNIPPFGFPGRDWETCMTINGSWGYKADDQKWKSTGELLRDLVDVASKGGNFLLNVGPMADGTIPAPSVDRLEEIGAWLRKNGEAIYGTSATPFGPELGAYSPTEKDKKGKPVFIPEWKWRCTVKPGRLHFLLLEWPHGVFEVHGLKSKVTKVYFLGDPQGKALPFEQQGENLKIILPEKQPDPLAPVLVAEIADQAPRTSYPSLKDQERQSATQTKGDLGAPSVK